MFIFKVIIFFYFVKLFFHDIEKLDLYKTLTRNPMPALAVIAGLTRNPIKQRTNARLVEKTRLFFLVMGLIVFALTCCE